MWQEEGGGQEKGPEWCPGDAVVFEDSREKGRGRFSEIIPCNTQSCAHSSNTVHLQSFLWSLTLFFFTLVLHLIWLDSTLSCFLSRLWDSDSLFPSP